MGHCPIVTLHVTYIDRDPMMTYGDHKETYSDPKVTYRDPKVTHSNPTHLPYLLSL